MCKKQIIIIAGIAATAVAATVFGIAYTAITGEPTPCLAGDSLCLPDADDVQDLIDAGKDGYNNGVDLDALRNGMIDKIDGINWPDFGFKFDDVFTFDDPRPRPGGRGNETLIGWKPPTDGSGEPLKLKVANALTSDWDEYFTAAVEDWDGAARVDGDADVMSLETERLEADPACTPVEGIMKVCNDDYGATGWEGINECLIMGDFIISSVAKMNEYYLHPDNYKGLLQGSTATLQDKRRYTMCHEIGHGFGLSHQDEEFSNADLNTCMDYSSRPANNLRPNPADYSALNILYGDSELLGDSEWGTPEVVTEAAALNPTRARALLRGQERQQRPTMTREFGYNFNGVEVEKRTYYLFAQE